MKSETMTFDDVPSGVAVWRLCGPGSVHCWRACVVEGHGPEVTIQLSAYGDTASEALRELAEQLLHTASRTWRRTNTRTAESLTTGEPL